MTQIYLEGVPVPAGICSVVHCLVDHDTDFLGGSACACQYMFYGSLFGGS
jgi:hypothetical protein